MKLCEFTPKDNYGRSSSAPREIALDILRQALEPANQAGLDGKKLSEFNIVSGHDPQNPLNFHVEIHAKVTHRLAPRPTP